MLNSSSASGIVQQSDATSDVNDEDDDYEHFATIAALASQGAAALSAAPPEVDFRLFVELFFIFLFISSM